MVYDNMIVDTLGTWRFPSPAAVRMSCVSFVVTRQALSLSIGCDMRIPCVSSVDIRQALPLSTGGADG